MSRYNLHDISDSLLNLSLDGRGVMKQYWHFFVEVVFYIGLAILGSSAAVLVLQSVFEVFYYG